MSDNDEELRELGKQLPWDRPDDARRDAVRSSLLVAATTAQPQRSRFAVAGGFAVGAVVAAAAVLLVVHRAQPEHAVGAERARIDATSAADFERQITQTVHGVDEVVRVRNGKLSLAIGALAANEHVRVATGDARIEGRGSYRLTVMNDALRELIVEQGSATLTITGHEAVFLAAGQTWRATIVTADVVPAAPAPVGGTEPSHPEHAPDHVAAAVRHRADAVAADPVAAAEHAAPAATAPEHATVPAASSPAVTALEPPAPTLTGKTELELHFAAGLALLKANKPAEAARELGSAVAVNASDPLAADARYFQAIALTKAGRKTEAEAALLGFLDHAPTSPRRGRAAVRLARLIAERGDAASARTWFESAAGDPDPNVAAAARAGIAALH